ncbi:MAG: hypothetical protein ABL994_07190 [Verrucomicrobiales bacterium]
MGKETPERIPGFAVFREDCSLRVGGGKFGDLPFDPGALTLT